LELPTARNAVAEGVNKDSLLSVLATGALCFSFISCSSVPWYRGPGMTALARLVTVTNDRPVLSSERSPSILYFVKFEVFTALTMKYAVFWDVTPRGSCTNPRYGGDTYLRNVYSYRVTRCNVPEDGVLKFVFFF
jgi:hypothetical protein